MWQCAIYNIKQTAHIMTRMWQCAVYNIELYQPSRRHRYTNPLSLSLLTGTRPPSLSLVTEPQQWFALRSVCSCCLWLSHWGSLHVVTTAVERKMTYWNE
jgi:hypothetical protein